MSLNLTDDKLTLDQALAWCHQTTSYYLSQCWPSSLSLYGATRPQWYLYKQYIKSWYNNTFYVHLVNSLRPRLYGLYFADDVLKCIFLNEIVWISLKIPLKFVPKAPINNIPALVQIMAWRRPGDQPLSEPMLVFVPTHICVTRPQWVKLPEETTRTLHPK